MNQPKKKRPDPATVKEKLRKTSQAKERQLKQDLKKLKTFKMPATKPRIGGTEKELEDQILGALPEGQLQGSQEEADAGGPIDLEFKQLIQSQLNTDDFGEAAKEADRKKEMAKRAKKKESTQGTRKAAAKKVVKKEKKEQDQGNLVDKQSDEEDNQNLGLFNKESEDEEGDQNIPTNTFPMFQRASEEEEGD